MLSKFKNKKMIHKLKIKWIMLLLMKPIMKWFFMKIIQIIKTKVKLKSYLLINGMVLDNYGFISFLINFLHMIIMKMIIL